MKSVIKKIIELAFLQEEIMIPNRKRVFLFMAADYGNLGDVAITLSQEEMLAEQFRDYAIVVIPISKTYKYYRSIRRQIKADDIITMIGGGNFGDLYLGYQLKREFIVKNFKNKIISFPQTYFFTDSRKGRRRREKNAKIMNAHGDIVLFARDSVSYKSMKNDLPNCVVELAPDVVMFKKITNKNKKRSGAVLLLRNDKESSLNNGKKSSILNVVRDAGFDVVSLDTQVQNGLNSNQLKNELKVLLDKISGSKFVITDRLHGMIFCEIMQTPCIVLENNNSKVKNTYMDWLEDCEYIALVKNVSAEAIENVCNAKANNRHYPKNKTLQEYLNV